MADATTPETLIVATKASWHMLFITVLAHVNAYPILSTISLHIVHLGGSYLVAGVTVACGSVTLTLSTHAWGKLASVIGFDRIRVLISLGSALSGLLLLVENASVVIVAYILTSLFFHGLWLSVGYYMNILNQTFAVQFISLDLALSFCGIAVMLAATGFLLHTTGTRYVMLAATLVSWVATIYGYMYVWGTQTAIRNQVAAERRLNNQEQSPLLSEFGEGEEDEDLLAAQIKWTELSAFFRINLVSTVAVMALSMSQIHLIPTFFVVYSRLVVTPNFMIPLLQLSGWILAIAATARLMGTMQRWMDKNLEWSHSTKFVLVPLCIVTLAIFMNLLELIAMDLVGSSKMSEVSKTAIISVLMVMFGVSMGTYNVVPSNILTEYTPPNCDYIGVVTSNRVTLSRIFIFIGQLLVGLFIGTYPRVLFIVDFGIVFVAFLCLSVCWVHYLSGQDRDFHGNAIAMMNEAKSLDSKSKCEYQEA